MTYYWISSYEIVSLFCIVRTRKHDFSHRVFNWRLSLILQIIVKQLRTGSPRWSSAPPKDFCGLLLVVSNFHQLRLLYKYSINRLAWRKNEVQNSAIRYRRWYVLSGCHGKGGTDFCYLLKAKSLLATRLPGHFLTKPTTKKRWKLQLHFLS